MYKIIMWGTTNQGEGHVMRLGEYDSVEDIHIYSAMLGPDILVTFSEEEEPIERPETKRADGSLRGQNGVDW